MALTSNANPVRRGPRRGDAFGYPVAPGEKIYAGGLVCVNASGQLVRLQTAGASKFVGIAQSGFDNSASASAGPTIVAAFDTYCLTVTGATAANITAPVYATDDATLTLSVPGSGFEGIVGHLVGIDNGQTYVDVKGY
jgi:hypothetical protein